MRDVMRYQDVLEPASVTRYEEQIHALHGQLVVLNTNLFLIEKIEAFRFDLFAPFDRTYWQTTKNAMIESSLMIIWRIITDDTTTSDPSKLSLTLPRLRGFVKKNWLQAKQMELKQFQKSLKDVDFDNVITEIASKIKEIRNNYLAHFNLEWNANPNPNRAFVHLSDMKRILTSSKQLFDLLCFQHGRGLWYWDYLSESPYALNRVHQTDIDNLLDSVARHSSLLNLPEKFPDKWTIWYDHDDMTPEDRKVLNEYRVKFGLPEVNVLSEDKRG